MTFIKPNGARGLIGLVGVILMGIGAVVLWGWGAGMFVTGLVIVVDASSDEIVERFTLTTRFSATALTPADGKTP